MLLVSPAHFQTSNQIKQCVVELRTSRLELVTFLYWVQFQLRLYFRRTGLE